jgi:integrase
MKDLKLVVYQNKTKANSKNEAPVYIRIKVGETQKEFSLGFKCNMDRWNSTNSLTLAKARLTEEEKKNRIQIDEKLSKMLKFADRMNEDGKAYNAEMVYNHLFKGDENKNKTLLQVYETFKEDFYILIQIGQRKESSFHKYEVVKGHLIKFMKEKYNLSDTPISLVDDTFQRDFHKYLMPIVCQNGIHKYIQHLRTLLTFAEEKKWVKSEITHYTIKKDKVKKQFLTRKEILAISQLENLVPHLEIVKDFFLFNCVTGFSWTDISTLTYDDMVDVDGDIVLSTQRDKTDVEENVPLTKEALYLIDKYRSHPECQASGRLFPVKTNVTVNKDLKDIARLAKIEKVLTTKVARNTFVTTGMNLNLNLKALSVTTGHTNVQMTETYGTLHLDTQIQEMKKYEGILQIVPLTEQPKETLEEILKVA